MDCLLWAVLGIWPCYKSVTLYNVASATAFFYMSNYAGRVYLMPFFISTHFEQAIWSSLYHRLTTTTWEQIATIHDTHNIKSNQIFDLIWFDTHNIFCNKAVVIRVTMGMATLQVKSFPHETQSLNSLSDKTSYRQISWSFEAARLDFMIVLSLWSLAGISAAALLPRCLSSFRAIGKV